MKYVLTAFILLLVALPISAVLTLMLSPFWNWFEMRTGIESIGHSGPAGWCYIAVYAVVLTLCFGAWFAFRPRKN